MASSQPPRVPELPDTTVGSPSVDLPPTDSPLGTETLRRVRRRVVPLIVLLYFVAYLDRNNIGFAKTQMSADLGLTNAAFGLGAGIFFIGYVIMEIPSNGGMHRFGARKWIARILVTWGFFACAMAFVSGETSLYVVRFLLGAAEAGFFPAVLYYFTLWFPARQRVAVLGTFVMAQPVANAIGAPLSGLLLKLDGVWGHQGWQWLFFLEGVPAILLGVLVPFLMTDRPKDAIWLSPSQRDWLVRTMAAEAAAKEVRHGHAFRAGLTDRRAWVYGLLNFGMVCGIYGLGLWLPTIIEGLGDYDSSVLGLLVMIPYAVSIPFVHWWASRAARTGRRAAHASASLALAAGALVAAGFALDVSPWLALAFLSVAAIGIYSAIGPFLSMPSALFAGAAAAASLGLVNSLGNIGGFVAPYAVGLIKDATDSDQPALVFLAGCLALTAATAYLFARRRPEGDARIDEAVTHDTIAAAPPKPAATTKEHV
jgi:ACS family tartrate transporter-like MFS transporter